MSTKSTTRGFVFFILMTSLMTASVAVAAGDTEGPVWHWYDQCAQGKTVEIQLLLDGKPFYESEFHACHVPRSQIQPEQQRRVMKFAYPQSGNKRLGAQDSEKIEGDIWEAGSDTNAILLGVSLSGPKREWLNTVYVVKFDGPFQLELEKGFVMKSTIKAGP